MVDLRGRGPGRGAPREQTAGGGSVPPRQLHGDGGGTRLGRAASVGRCGGGLELGGGWNGAEGRARARRTNGGDCGSWAPEQGPALAFMGEQGEGEGDGRWQRGRAARAAAAALGRMRLSPSVACAAERGVSEGGVRARVGVMARRSEAAARRQQAQRGSSAAAADAARQQRGVVRAAQ